MAPTEMLPTGAVHGPIISHMGELHQLFVIARVKGRYQCVAAFISQWLFGHMVINAADRLIRAFINPINAAAIASELATLEQIQIDHIADKDNDQEENPPTLCPYLTGLFMSAFRIDMGRNRVYELRVLDVYGVPNEYDNNNGYTCFDVTDPGNPRYCFWWPETGPLSAIGYLRTEEDKRIDVTTLRFLKNFRLIDVATLAAVWPEDFNQHLKRGQVLQPLAIDASPPFPSDPAAAAEIRKILSSAQCLGVPDITSKLGSLAQPRRLALLRTELVAAKALNANGLLLLKLLLAAEKSKLVDLKPWLSTDAFHAASLIDLTDALSHAEYLDLSFASTLTTEIVQDLVPRLPNLRHLVALCTTLTPLTTVLPLTSYLTSLPLQDAVEQSRLRTPDSLYTPECLRWVEESDPPAALTVVMYAPSLEQYVRPRVPRRYGVELAHFGAEAVVHGFTRFLEHLYDLHYRATSSQSGCYFEMRGYFHPNSAVPVRDCLGASRSSDMAACYAFGCMPSLIRDGRDAKVECAAGTGSLTSVPRYPGWVLVVDTKGTMPFHNEKPQPVPTEIAPVLSFMEARMGTFDMRAYIDGMDGPESALYQRGTPEPTGRGPDVWLLDSTANDPSARAGAESESVTAERELALVTTDGTWPEYAFERWDVLPDEKAKGLQPVERISVREWVGRLPAGHGPVSEAVLAKCEAALSRLNVTLSHGSRAARELAPGPLQVEYRSADLPPCLVVAQVRLGAVAAFMRELGKNKGKISAQFEKPRTKRGRYRMTILKK